MKRQLRINSPIHSTHPKNGRDFYFLLGFIVIGLLLRGALLCVMVSHPERAFWPDTQGYLDPALKLLASGVYPADSAIRTPLYPIFISLVFRIGGENPILIIIAQVILSTLTVLLTYHLGIRILPRPAALIGALLMAICVESVTHSLYLLTETLFTFLFLASMLTWVKARQDSNRSWLVFAALLMGLCVLCRPIALYFPLLLVAFHLLDLSRRWSSRLKEVVIYLSILALVLFPWLLRNQLLIGFPSVSTISDYNLLFYNAASLEMHLKGVTEAEIRPELASRVNQTMANLGWQDTEANRARVHRLLARQIILAHPVRYLYIHLKSDLNSFLPDLAGPAQILGLTLGGKGTLSVSNQHGLKAAIRNYFGGSIWPLWVFAPIVALQGLIYMVDAIGIVWLARKRAWHPLIVLILPVMYFMLIPGAPSVPRFRVPVMPNISLLFGLGLNMVWLALHRRKSSSGNPLG